jgi:hypothetical protein
MKRAQSQPKQVRQNKYGYNANDVAAETKYSSYKTVELTTALQQADESDQSWFPPGAAQEQTSPRRRFSRLVATIQVHARSRAPTIIMPSLYLL